MAPRLANIIVRIGVVIVVIVIVHSIVKSITDIIIVVADAIICVSIDAFFRCAKGVSSCRAWRLR